KDHPQITSENLQVLFEITLTNLRQEGEIDERDFLNRADILCKLGYNVLISNYQEYYKLVDYFSEYTRNRTQIGLAMGVNNLLAVFQEEYYSDLSGGIMEAFGKLFKRNVKVYLYPYMSKTNGELLNAQNLKVSDNLKDLYKFFKLNGKIEDIIEYNPKNLEIHSRKILKMINNCETGWEDSLPGDVAAIIKEKGMFGYDEEKCKFVN